MSIYFKTTIKNVRVFLFFSIKIFPFTFKPLFLFLFFVFFTNNAEQAHGHFYYKTNNKMQIFMLSY